MVTGEATVGQTLTVDPGGWSGDPEPTFTYQWQRCEQAAPSATYADVTWPVPGFSGGMALDPGGNVFLASLDGFEGAVDKFGPTGSPLATYTNPAISGVWDVAADAAGNVYATNQFSETVTRTTPEGITTVFTEFDGTVYPAGIDIDGAGNVYVTSTTDDAGKVFKYAPDGTEVTTGGFPINFGAEEVPQDVAVDSAGRIYVIVSNYSDEGLIARFLPNGTADGEWGRPAALGGGPFEGVLSIALDGADDLFVAESDRVVVFDDSMTYLTSWIGGSGGGGGTAFSGLRGIAAGADGAVYTSQLLGGSGGNGVMQKFTFSTGPTCQPIADADAQSYQVSPDDGGNRLRAKVTASNSEGSAEATSALTPEVRVSTLVVDDTGTATGSTGQTGICEAPNFNTIQAAVDAATADDTIQVCAGTYTENLTVDKNLTLKGPNFGISAGWDPGTRVTEATVVGQAVVSASDTVIDGFQFNRPNVDNTTTPRLISSSGLSGQITVQNNIFEMGLVGSVASPPANYGCAAATWGTAAWRIYDNQFRKQRYAGVCGDQYNSRAVFAESANPVEIDGNYFTRTEFAIYITGSQPNGSEVTNNLIEAVPNTSVGRGIVTSSSDMLIEGNTIGGTGPNLWIENGKNNTVKNNRFLSGTSTVDLGQIVLKGTQSGNTFRKNSFVSTTRSLINDTADEPVDARDNWWGASFSDSEGFITLFSLGRGNTPPAAGWNSVDINPWIGGATAPKQDPAKTGAPGFWPIDYPTTSPITALPSASGAALVGSTLTGTEGTWSNDPTITYQWQASTNGGVTWSGISGATNSTYQISSARKNQLVKLLVRGTNTDGRSYAFSNTIGPIKWIENTEAPTVSGVRRVGQTLTTTDGTWSADPAVTGFTYSWHRCEGADDEVGDDGCEPITGPGASSAEYELTTADEGSFIRSAVAATSDAATSPAIGSSNVKGPVLPANPGAETYFVNDSIGNNANDCLSADQPCKTIQKGIDLASAGGTVIVAAGTYSDEQTGDFTDIYIPPGKNGLTIEGAADQAAPVVELDELKPDESGRQVAGVDVRSDGVTIEGIAFEPAPSGDYGPEVNFRIAANAGNPEGVQGFTLRDVTSTGSHGQNIQIQKGDTAQAIVTHSDLVFENVTIEDSGGRGIFVAGNDQIVDGLTVSDSTFRNLGLLGSDPGSKHGIQTQAPVDDLTITDTTFEGVPSGGISLLAAVGGENLIEDVTVSGTTAANGDQSGISVINLTQRPDGSKSVAENITINRATVTGFSGRGIVIAAANYGGCASGCEVVDVTLRNSTITNAANNAVMVFAGSAGTSASDVTVRNNAISFTGPTSGKNGVYLEGYFGPLTSPIVTKNTFSGGARAVYALGQSPSTGGTVTRNSLRAGSSGDPAVGIDFLDYGGMTAPDGTCNWWGQASGAASGQAVGDVNTGSGTLRFLQSAGLDSPCIGNPQPSIDPATSFKTVGSLVSLQNAGNWDIPEGTGPVTLGYQWEECDFFICEPGDWSPIPGATGASYRLVESDLGKRLRAVITATNPGPGGGSATYPALDVFRNPFGPIVAPSSSAEQLTPTGDDVQITFPALDNGQQVQLDFGCGITGEGTTTVQSRDESQVPEARGFRFGDPPTAATIETTAEYDCSGGRVISVCTTYDVASLPDGIDPKLFHFTGGAWQDVTVSWDPTTGILCGDVTSFSPFAVGRAAASPTNTAQPEISGTAKVGETLSATPGTWSGDQPITYAYQWVRCDSSGAGCSDIAGASASSYVPGAADAGKRLKVEVDASNDVGSASASSDPTAAVETDPPSPPGPPGKPNLKVTVSSAKKARAGKPFGVSIEVANRQAARAFGSGRSVRAVDVRTCLKLPKGTSVTAARGAKVSGRSACWTRSSLELGGSVTYRLKIRALRSGSGARTLRATTTAQNAEGESVTSGGQVKIRILKAKRPRPNTPTG